MITLFVPDMTCGHCKASVEAALGPIASAVKVDLPNHRVTIEDAASSARAIAALDAIGFPAQVVDA